MRRVLAGLLVWLVLSPAFADDPSLQPLRAEQINTLLLGNTAVGAWNGTPYRQYFMDNGETIYAQQGTQSERGNWRVNGETNRYESRWRRSGWSSYGLARDGERLFWISDSLPPQEFSMLPGERLVE